MLARAVRCSRSALREAYLDGAAASSLRTATRSWLNLAAAADLHADGCLLEERLRLRSHRRAAKAFSSHANELELAPFPLLLHDGRMGTEWSSSTTIAGAAAVSGPRGGGITGTLPRPPLGASTRFVSTAAAVAADAAAAGGAAASPSASRAGVAPSVVLVKVVGAASGGKYLPFAADGLLSMYTSDLLEALAGSKVFALKFKDVDLSACSVVVVKNAALPAGVKVPPAAHETGDNVVEMEGAATVGDMAMEVGVSGAPLFVRVGLPGAPPAAVATFDHIHDSAKKFTVNGAIEPLFGGHYFYLRPNISAFVKHFDARAFFFLYGPRGAGKTTSALHALAAARERGWYGLNVDLSGLSHKDVDSFWRELGHRLSMKADEWKLKLQPISSASRFQGAFSQSALGAAKVVLMFDEFDALEAAAPGVKESFLGAVRSIKQDLGSSAIQCIFAVGPFNILAMEGKTASSFNVREDLSAPFLTEQQVVELLAQFTAARGLVLEDGIAADVFRLTAGHAGLVCACGKALDTPEKVSREAGRVSIAAWRAYTARELQTDAMNWSTVARMVKHVASLPAEPRRMLETAVFHGIDTLTLRGQPMMVLEAAAHLATEGWLLPLGGRAAVTFSVTSPLVRSLALHALASLRAVRIKEPLPLVDGVLDFGAVVALALPAFEGRVMREAATLSSKRSRATLPGVPSRQPVPKEATYHSQLFAVTRQWFSVANHADVYDQAGVDGAGEKEAADLLVVGRVQGGDKAAIPAPKHIVELAASDNTAAIKKHYVRTIHYMTTHKTDRGTCITFTALRTVPDVHAVDVVQLAWPSAAQLSKGMVAVHVVHDMAWSYAAVFSRQHGQAPIKRTVDLSPAAVT